MNQTIALLMLVCVVVTSALPSGCEPASNAAPTLIPKLTLAGDWKVRVEAGEVVIGGKTNVIPAPVTLDVPPSPIITVTNEAYDSLPIFNGAAAGWTKGAKLRGLATQETTANGYLVPDSVVVSAAADGSQPLVLDKDYSYDRSWATIGRLAGGQIGEKTPVYISYRYGPSRLDSVIIDKDGQFTIRTGAAQVSLAAPPSLAVGETRIANLWIPGRLARLTEDSIFPILETEYPKTVQDTAAVEKALPKTLAKLRAGQHVKILAWGDSVTEGNYLPSRDERWQVQFVERLKQRFPKADIELVSEAWGGRNTDSYLQVPPGQVHNYAETVLAVKPDLVISEFVNDAGFNAEKVQTRYSALLADFQKIGAEWIIHTPHYVMPSWMSLNRERNIDNDPRAYVTALRKFAAENPVTLSDASLRWGRLWRQGIPYTTLLSNQINHPDKRGMKLFADSLMDLLPAQ